MFCQVFTVISNISTEEIEAECPWYLEMRELVGKRPNQTPTGIGNSESDIDTNVLGLPVTDSIADSSEPVSEADLDDPTSGDELGGFSTSDAATTQDPANPTSDFESDNEDVKSSEAAISVSVREPVKTANAGPKKTSAAAPLERTAPQPSTLKSTVTTAQRPSKKARLDVGDFTAIAAAEEQTRQKEIELRRTQLSTQLERSRLHTELKKIKAEEAARKDGMALRKLELRAQIKSQMLKQDYELRLAQLRASTGTPSFSMNGEPSMGHSGFSTLHHPASASVSSLLSSTPGPSAATGSHTTLDVWSTDTATPASGHIDSHISHEMPPYVFSPLDSEQAMPEHAESEDT